MLALHQRGMLLSAGADRLNPLPVTSFVRKLAVSSEVALIPLLALLYSTTSQLDRR
jgi:hypothetical protein